MGTIHADKQNMRRRDFERWRSKTGDDYTLHLKDGDTAKRRFYAMPLGEAMRAYINHVNMSWWRKLAMGSEWLEVEKKLRGILNDEKALVWSVTE